jgi:cobalt transporter subunit CbtA
MFRRIFLTALLAGLIGGLVVSVVQEFTTTPVILHAEEFENAAPDSGHKHGALRPGLALSSTAHAHEHGEKAAAATEPEAWGPENGIERTLHTTLANVLAGVGFALVLTALFTLSGRNIDGPTGVLWGLGGFAAFTLAPSLGLPPEVPGSMAAELNARQGWWLLCVAATAAGLWMLVFRKGSIWIAAGLALLVLPHAIGAPQPDRIGGGVPPEIAAHFVAASIVTAAIFWCALGWLAGTFWKKLEPSG